MVALRKTHWDDYKLRTSHQNSFHITGKPYAEWQDPLKGSVELDAYAVDAAGSSVINQEPKFKNKVDESIYRLKNKK